MWSYKAVPETRRFILIKKEFFKNSNSVKRDCKMPSKTGINWKWNLLKRAFARSDWHWQLVLLKFANKWILEINGNMEKQWAHGIIEIFRKQMDLTETWSCTRNKEMSDRQPGRNSASPTDGLGIIHIAPRMQPLAESTHVLEKLKSSRVLLIVKTTWLKKWSVSHWKQIDKLDIRCGRALGFIPLMLGPFICPSFKIQAFIKKRVCAVTQATAEGPGVHRFS